ncbi:MAG: ubiquinol oxidase subunit II [Hyphomicrobiales bacterium]|nr:ubiquinol oxidase subunit II [Hyphomicrobiales bacterium]
MRRVLSFLGVVGPLIALAGCTFENAPILDPKGPVGEWERDILFRAFGIMMIVVIPVFVMTAWFAWRYRSTNTKARYDPDWMSNKVDAVTWIVPALIVTALAIHVWIFTHALDPYKPLESDNEPIEVQVIAQDWKWLFIYPEQGVASVNQLAFPSNVPLSLKITSDTVMNSFFVPALGSQIYAMAGMQTQLNLLADEPGTFVGRNMQYSGDGFADQHFEAIAMPRADFDAWVATVKGSAAKLSDEAYEELAKPSSAHPVIHYSAVSEGLFDRIVLKYDCGMTCSAETK